MSIIVRPISDTELHRACVIEVAAYADSNLSPILFPGPFPPDSQQQRVDQLSRSVICLQFPTAGVTTTSCPCLWLQQPRTQVSFHRGFVMLEASALTMRLNVGGFLDLSLGEELMMKFRYIGGCGQAAFEGKGSSGSSQGCHGFTCMWTSCGSGNGFTH